MLGDPFRGSAALAGGLLTPGVLRGPRYRRLFPDVYVPSGLTPDLELRSRAAHLWLAGDGVLAGYSAAELYHAPCAPADALVEVVIPGGSRRAPTGITVRRDVLASDEHRQYRGLGLTTPVRTAYDLARRTTLVEAVVALDALAGRFGFPPADLLTLAARYPQRRVVRDTRRYTRLVDLGWRVYRYLAADVYSTPDRTVDELRRALRVRHLA